MSIDKYPRQVRIITTRGEVGHNFKCGSIVTLTSTHWASYSARGYCVDRGHEDTQVVLVSDFEEIVKETRKETVVAKRVKMLYTVQDSDGDILFITQDRTLAREVKAEEGGKANGVVIVQYGELKEIR